MQYKCLDGSVYESFIREAVKRSDLIEILVQWPEPYGGLDGAKKALLKEGFSQEHVDISISQLEKRTKEEIQLFYHLTVPFLKKLEPYFIGEPVIRHSSKCYLLRCDPDIIPILLEPKRISAWGYPLLPDNLSFITDGKYWFFSESHEDSCTLYADDENDYEFWSNMGIVFSTDFDYEWHVKKRPQLGDL